MRISDRNRTLGAHVIALLFCLSVCSATAHAADAGDAAKIAFAQQIKAALSPADQTWLVKEARESLTGKPLVATTVRQHVGTRFAARKFDESTLDALFLATLAEIQSQAAADQRSIQTAMSKIKEAQDALAVTEAFKDALDSLGETSQQLAVELQLMMQRMTAAAAMISNIAAKDAAAKNAVIGNIKG